MIVPYNFSPEKLCFETHQTDWNSNFSKMNRFCDQTCLGYGTKENYWEFVSVGLFRTFLYESVYK